MGGSKARCGCVPTLKMADHSEIHRHPEEEAVPTAFILPNRWHYRAESLGRDHKMFMLIVSVNNIQIFKRLEYSLSLSEDNYLQL